MTEESFNLNRPPGADGQPQCLVCGGHDLAVKYDFGHAFSDGKIWRCRFCGMMMLWPQPTSESLRSIYDDKYFKNEKFLSNNIASLYGYVDYLSEKRHKRLDMGIILRSIREQLKAPQTEFGIRNSGLGSGTGEPVPNPETRDPRFWKLVAGWGCFSTPPTMEVLTLKAWSLIDTHMNSFAESTRSL